MVVVVVVGDGTGNYDLSFGSPGSHRQLLDVGSMPSLNRVGGGGFPEPNQFIQKASISSSPMTPTEI